MSFIASLAAVGTAVGVTGAVAAPLAGAGVLAAGGAALGAGTSALMGGDPGEGALMGGIMGPLTAPLMPAAGAGAAAGSGAGTAALNSSLTAGSMGLTGGGAAGLGAGTGLTASAGGIGTLGTAGSSALGGSLTAGSMGLTGGGAAGLGAAGSTAGLGAAAAPGLGTAMGATSAGSALPMAASMGGPGLAAPSALGSIGEFAAAHPIMTGAGVGALGGAITNPNDPMKGALQGGAAGAIGGWGAGQLGGMAGAGGTLGKIGQFAASNPGITSAGIGMLASPVIGGIMPDFSPSEQDKLNTTNEQERANFLRYMRQFRPSLAPGYAAGGITDLDGYMSNAQNIPNPNEVANPQGYGSESVRFMAGGGLANLIPGGSGVADWLTKNSLPGMIFGWEGASDVPLIGGMFQDQSQIANLTPEEKKKLMDMAAAQGKPAPAMARGGIADLGGYSKGGNLLAGPGDGVSDDIPASIAGKQPARLAAGEYVVPSRIVSELGNGSTDAGAKRLDAMVQKINAGRSKTLGGKKYAKDTRAYKHLPV